MPSAPYELDTSTADTGSGSTLAVMNAFSFSAELPHHTRPCSRHWATAGNTTKSLPYGADMAVETDKQVNKDVHVIRGQVEVTAVKKARQARVEHAGERGRRGLLIGMLGHLRENLKGVWQGTLGHEVWRKREPVRGDGKKQNKVGRRRKQRRGGQEGEEETMLFKVCFCAPKCSL